jgi:hypothetical protein
MTATALLEESELFAENESDRVLRWRCEELRRAGYVLRDALLLAISPEVDLHLATDLLRSGCPTRTAARILL